MERSMSFHTDHTDYTDYTESSAHTTSYPSNEPPYTSSDSSQFFTPSEAQMDVNGQLGNFAELDLTGMEGQGLAGMGVDPRWTTLQGDYQQALGQYPPATTHGDTNENNSLPFPQTYRHYSQPPLDDSWLTMTGQSPVQDYNPNFGYPALPAPIDYTYPQSYPNAVDEGSSSQPGTEMISPQAIFPAAFVNSQEHHASHYPSTYYDHPLVHFPNGQAVQYQPSYTQMPVPPNVIPGQMPMYNQVPLHPASIPLSRANSMSSADKVRTKTCLSKENRLAIYEMTRKPNIRQQDVALEFGIDRSTVSKIVTDFKKTAERRQKGEEEVPVPKQSKSGVARYPEVDTACGLYVDAQHARGLNVSQEELHELALKVAAKSGHRDFKASVKWADNFNKRRAMEGKVVPGKPLSQYTSPVTSYPSVPGQATPNETTPKATTPILDTPVGKAVGKSIPIGKSFSATNLMEMAGPSHARQRSQSSPQKAGAHQHIAGLPTHQQPLPISQSSLPPRPSLTRSNSLNMSSRGNRGHRSRASIGSPSLARSAFQLDTSLAPVQEDGPISMPPRFRHTYSRSDALGLGSWANIPPSMLGNTPYHPGPPYPSPHPPGYGDFEPPSDAGPSGSKRARR